MSLIPDDGAGMDDPLSVVERMANRNNWEFSRPGDEIILSIAGKRTNYQVSFSWMEDIKVLHFACSYEMKFPLARMGEVLRLISSINEQLWLGHFDVWGQNGLVIYRHSLLLIDGVSTSARQCEALLGAALDSCERYYPAVQFVVWAGKSAREALDATMVDTLGEA
jgi:hypothetical protein